jgi:hypothetical protein
VGKHVLQIMIGPKKGQLWKIVSFDMKNQSQMNWTSSSGWKKIEKIVIITGKKKRIRKTHTIELFFEVLEENGNIIWLPSSRFINKDNLLSKV